MDNFVRCKACGYVTKQGKVGAVCPACGVPAKMFEPYTHPVSLKRRRILDLHTHPVMVHLPQAFALTLLGLSLVFFFTPESMTEIVVSTLRLLSILLPFVAVLAVVTGLMDGKLRFRRVSTPLLKKKMMLSAAFFICALTIAGLAVFGDLRTLPFHLIHALFALLVTLCGALLGLIGGKLLDAKFPG